MTECMHGSHRVLRMHFHIMWVTKYRKKILVGDVAVQLREMVRAICAKESVEIIRGAVSSDHVHLFVSTSPKTTISKLVKLLKGKTSHILMQTSPSLKKQYWGRHMWARGYFCCTSGNVTDEMMKGYIENQSDEDDDDTFKLL